MFNNGMLNKKKQRKTEELRSYGYTCAISMVERNYCGRHEVMIIKRTSYAVHTALAKS